MHASYGAAFVKISYIDLTLAAVPTPPVPSVAQVPFVTRTVPKVRRRRSTGYAQAAPMGLVRG